MYSQDLRYAKKNGKQIYSNITARIAVDDYVLYASFQTAAGTGLILRALAWYLIPPAVLARLDAVVAGAVAAVLIHFVA